MIAGLVLAGGAAVRMGGGDKPLLAVGAAPILARILATLRPQVGPLALSANGDPARFAEFGLPVLTDGPFAGAGPLAGVLAGLDWAEAQGATALLSVPGDTPFIPADLAARLGEAPACAESAGVRHHLVALWPVAARAALRAWLGRPGSRSVRQFAGTIGMRGVAFPAGEPDPFMNVNTPDDLARARRIAAPR